MKQDQSSFKSCSMGCLMMLFMGFLFIFVVKTCDGDGDTDSVDSSSIEHVKLQDPMESKAVAMARQIVIVNLHTSSDVDFSEEEVFSIGDNAYDVLGHYTLNGEEHKYDLRLHYKGGEWTAISNWEWSRLQLMRVGATDLDEDLHGTWTDDVSF